MPRCGANCCVEINPPTPRPERGDDRDFLEELVIDLDLSIRARNLINHAGAKTVGELLQLSSSDLRSVWHSDSEAQVAEISEFLALRCLSLKDDR
jgi:DNA-directed RNA polymerase alpha subunit